MTLIFRTMSERSERKSESGSELESIVNREERTRLNNIRPFRAIRRIPANGRLHSYLKTVSGTERKVEIIGPKSDAKCSGNT